MDSRFPTGDRQHDPPPARLASRADFMLAAARVRPSLRRIEGPAGTAILEPRVMRVLLAFTDASGAVLSRDQLLQRCWDGAVVGDDAINRTIAEIRRVARDTQSGFGIQTIPRIGYRLEGAVGEAEPATIATPAPPATPAVGPAAVPAPTMPASGAGTASPDGSPQRLRRQLLVGALAAAGGATLGYGWARRPRDGGSFQRLVEQARRELRLGLPGGVGRARDQLEQAVVLRETDAAAHGLLALAWYQSFQQIGPGDTSGQARGEALARSLHAAERARELDEGEPNAAVVLALLDARDDWHATDQRLRRVLQRAPDNAAALDSLVALLQGGGYVHESHALNQQALQFDRLRPIPVWRNAVKLWILGQDDEAARAVSAARDRLEMDNLAWQAALVVYAFTGDYAAAGRLLDQPGEMMSPQGRDAWRKSLLALEQPTAAHVAAARAAMEQVAGRPVMASHAIMVLASLGDIDTAFHLFESRGFLPSLRVAEGTTYENAASRWHQWLFCPAARNLHAHPGFERVCERLGLVAYWSSRGELPDVPLSWLPVKSV